MGSDFTDSHVHFWDTSLRRYPWLDGVPALGGAHGPSDLVREAAGDAPSRVVFVQADCERGSALDEVGWVESLPERQVRVAGIVAFAPMDAGRATREALRAVSAAIGTSVPRVALAWQLTRPFVTSIIIGAKSKEQLTDNLGAVEVKLSPEHVAALDTASALPAEYPGWMVDWQNREERAPAAK